MGVNEKGILVNYIEQIQRENDGSEKARLQTITKTAEEAYKMGFRRAAYLAMEFDGSYPGSTSAETSVMLNNKYRELREKSICHLVAGQGPICGYAKGNDAVTRYAEKVTCPECRKIILDAWEELDE